MKQSHQENCFCPVWFLSSCLATFHFSFLRGWRRTRLAQRCQSVSQPCFRIAHCNTILFLEALWVSKAHVFKACPPTLVCLFLHQNTGNFHSLKCCFLKKENLYGACASYSWRDLTQTEKLKVITKNSKQWHTSSEQFLTTPIKRN